MPAQPSLAGVRAKIDRAGEHLQLLDEETAAFYDAKAVELVGQFEPQTTEYVFRAHVRREPPPRFGAIVGDFAHNLRSALEHLVYQLVVLAGNEALWSRDHQFPTLTTSAKNFHGSAPTMLAGVRPDHIALIERYQPYHAPGPDAHAFAILNALTREDKHKIVLATHGFFRPGPKPNIRFTLDPADGTIVYSKLAKSRRVKDGADVVRVKLAPLGTNPQVEMHGDLPLDIAFGERALRGTALQEIGSFVSRFIDLFAGDFR